MKKNFLFAALIAATAMFASCSEDLATTDTGETEAARITIDLTDPTTRAFDEDSDDDDKVVNDLIVFVTRADGNSFDVSPVYVPAASISAQNKFTVTATTKAAKIYIVTNTGALATGPFKAVTNLNDVKAVAAKIDGTGANAGSKVAPGNVWMSGEGALVDAAAHADGTAQKEATIKLYYVPAKVFVIVKNSMKNYPGKTVLSGVTLINAGTWTGFVNSNANTTFDADNRPEYRVARTTAFPQFPYYANGVAIDDFASNYSDVPALVASANDFTSPVAAYAQTTGFTTIQTAAGASTKASLTEADAFYVFPTQIGSPSPEKVWASVYGTYTADTTPQQRFWSVAFGGADGIVKELKSGNKYIITLELAGDGQVPGGEDDPTIETLSAYLNVTVEQAEWIVSTPYKKFE